jgi:hypothetical protein
MKTLLANLTDFAPESRVWVYVLNRRLTEQEAQFVQQQAGQFVRGWTAHDAALQAAAEVFDRQAILLMVDETRAGASGCSIDKSVHFLEQLGQAVGADFFERMRFAWVDESGNLQWSNRAEFADQLAQQKIKDDTLIVNTLAGTKRDLQEKWLQPMRASWHRRIF